MNTNMNLPKDDTEYNTNKLKEGEASVESLQRKREEDFSKF